MFKHRLPESVEKAIGQEAARDLEQWVWQLIEEAIARAQLPISDYIARQKVNVLMLNNVSDRLLAGDPDLTLRDNERLVWRVPVYLTSGLHGRVGQVGLIDVDVRRGEIYYTDDSLKKIAEESERLATDSA